MNTMRATLLFASLLFACGENCNPEDTSPVCDGELLLLCLDSGLTAQSCSQGCDPEANQCISCGDGVTSLGEECDDGNFDEGDDCDPNCTAPRCGNGVQGADELCFITTPRLLPGLDGRALVSGDFTNDGTPDLLTSTTLFDGQELFSSLVLLPGQGDGQFETPREFVVQDAPSVLLAVETDGELDAIGFIPEQELRLFPNQSGFFSSPAQGIAAVGIRGILVQGDLNGDGRMDLVTEVADTSLQILSRQEDNTFLASSLALDGFPVDVAIADLNSDGHQDLITLVQQNFGADFSLQIFEGQGNSFLLSQSFLLSVLATAVEVADFNQDNSLDIAFAALSPVASGEQLSLGLSLQSAGSFGAPEILLLEGGSIFSGAGPQGFVAGLINGDELTDLAIVDFGVGVLILTQTGDGFATHSFLVSAHAIDLNDWNNDGAQDIAFLDLSLGDVGLLLSSP
jgi:cysteine-rich repeat protein